MKNVFDLNVQTEQYDGEKEFLARRSEGDLLQKKLALVEEVQIHQKNSGLPLWLLIVMYVLGGFGLICMTSFLTAPLGEEAVSYAQAYANAPWVIWAGVPCLLVGAVLFVVQFIRKKNVEQSSAFQHTAEEIEKFVAESYEALGIPSDAVQCDVLMPAHKIAKSGKRRAAVAMANYINGSWMAFREGDDLCLGDATNVFRIPRERIGRLARINKRVMFMGWNKDVPFNKGEYKQYKMGSNNYGAVGVKPYLSLQILGSEEYEILFPPYEAETVQRLTGRYPE